MKLELNHPPRQFQVGVDNRVTLSDCARIVLAVNEAAHVTNIGQDYQWPVVRRRWGFALPTPLDNPGPLRAVISGTTPERSHLLLWSSGAEPSFKSYERREEHRHFARFGDRDGA